MTLHRNPGDFIERSCTETLHRDLLRSCQETSYRDLSQRSCQDTSSGCTETLHRDLLLAKRFLTYLAKRAFIESLQRDLISLAKRPLKEVCALLQRSCTQILQGDRFWRSCAETP